MKRTFAGIARVVSMFLLVVAMSLSVLSPKTVAAQSGMDDLTAKQLDAMAGAARTAAEHARIAEYYRAKAQDYLAEARLHEAMIAVLQSDPARASDKTMAGMVSHCQELIANAKQMAAKAQAAAEQHAAQAGGTAQAGDMAGMDMGAAAKTGGSGMSCMQDEKAAGAMSCCGGDKAVGAKADDMAGMDMGAAAKTGMACKCCAKEKTAGGTSCCGGMKQQAASGTKASMSCCDGM